MKIKIFLADDQYLMLEGIKAILKHEPEIEIVGMAQDGHTAIAQVIKLQPDLVLIDIEMPKMNGIVATKYICEHMPDTKVIVLTSHKKPSYVSEALQAGASGYLSKDTLIQDLKQAIHALGQGDCQIETKLVTPTVDRLKTTNLVRYKRKIAYIKKYRRSIYKPTRNSQRPKIRQNASRIVSSNSAHFNISRDSLNPFCNSPTAQEILMLYLEKSQTQRLLDSQKNSRHQRLKRIAWMLIAIASFILSIILF
jgi:DNA-binding NarL/FixJ family response regulator